MAPMKPNNNYSSSSNYGEDVNRQANILASCYVVDPSASSLKGLHYCTTGAAGAECPPLAAITATNELALTPKAGTRSARQPHNGSSGRHHNPRQQHRRVGATSRIRGECERFFCETLRATFLGEGNDAPRVSRLTDVYYNQQNDYNNHNYGTGFDGARGNNNGGRAVVDANGQLTPPDYFPIGDHAVMAARHAADQRMSGSGGCETSRVAAWMEIWDYAGGNSFRAFVSEDNMGEDRSLFVFFDADVVGRDLKQALVALIELAEGPLGCSHMVIAVDRVGLTEEEEERKPLLTGLQWAGFSLTTLDFWTGGVDVTSPRWLFMGMEV